MTDVMPLRSRNRLNAMVAIQDAAYELFTERAYAAVTVEEIARRSGVGPATVYRPFGTNKHILIWNEHDGEIAELVVERLRSQPRSMRSGPHSSTTSRPWPTTIGSAVGCSCSTAIRS